MKLPQTTYNKYIRYSTVSAMQEFPEFPPDQTWLIDRMQRLRYKADEGGICYGIAYMAIQAILSRDFPLFYERLKQINKIPVDQFPEEIEKIRQQRLGILDQAKTISLTEFKHEFNLESLEVNALNESDRKRFDLLVQKNFDALLKSLPLSEQARLTINHFLDGVEIYYQAHHYRHLFEEGAKPAAQSAAAAATLVLPVKLQNENSEKTELPRVSVSTGIYTVHDLYQYFATLQENFSDYPQSFPMIINSSLHTISIEFNPSSMTWRLVDPSQVALADPDNVKNDLTHIEMAELLHAALSIGPNNSVAFAAHFFAAPEAMADMKNYIKKLEDNQTWQALHAPTSLKALQFDSTHANWLYHAAAEGDVQKVNQLLEKKADPNREHKKQYTPFLVAIQNSQVEVVKAFLKHAENMKNNSTVKKIDPNWVSSKGLPPLYLAAFVGNVEIVKLLLESGFDPNISYLNLSPLKVAEMQGNNEVITLIQQHVEKKREESMPSSSTSGGASRPESLFFKKAHSEKTFFFENKNSEKEQPSEESDVANTKFQK